VTIQHDSRYLPPQRGGARAAVGCSCTAGWGGRTHISALGVHWNITGSAPSSPISQFEYVFHRGEIYDVQEGGGRAVALTTISTQKRVAIGWISTGTYTGWYTVRKPETRVLRGGVGVGRGALGGARGLKRSAGGYGSYFPLQNVVSVERAHSIKAFAGMGLQKKASRKATHVKKSLGAAHPGRKENR